MSFTLHSRNLEVSASGRHVRSVLPFDRNQVRTYPRPFLHTQHRRHFSFEKVKKLL